MTTYNSYEAAKIANQECEIVEWSGEFAPLISAQMPKYWTKCNPADHCMTVEKFLADGHKFVEGDIYLNSNGQTLGVVNIPVYNNEPSTIDCDLYVLRAAALEKIPTETPEEKEAMDGIDSAGEVEWNGEGFPPIGVIYTTEPHFEIELLCKYSSEYVVVGEMLPKETYKGMEVVIDTMDQRDRTFRKPETPQQREYRERLEAAYDLYLEYRTDTPVDFEIFKEAGVRKRFLRIVDKTNYRKEKTHGTN